MANVSAAAVRAGDEVLAGAAVGDTVRLSHVLDAACFADVTSQVSERGLMASLESAAPLVAHWSARLEALKDQHAGVVKELPNLLQADHQECTALAGKLSAVLESTRAALDASGAEQAATETLSVALSSLSKDIDVLQTTQRYLSSLSAALEDSEAARQAVLVAVNGPSASPTAASVSSPRTGAGSRAGTPRAGTPALVHATDCVTTLALDAAALRGSRGRATTLRRCSTLVDHLRKGLVAALKRSMVAMGWPRLKDSKLSTKAEVLSEFTALCQALIRLQVAHCTHVATPPTSVLPVLWVVEALVAPLRARFRFHFRGSRATNRVDKPEWCFVYVTDAVRDHAAFLAGHLQGVVRDVHGTLSGSPLSGVDALSQFVHCLVAEVAVKVGELVPVVQEDTTMLGHLIDELIVFEQALQSEFSYCVGQRLPNEMPYAKAVSVFTADDDVLQLWVAADKALATASLHAALDSPVGWTSHYNPASVRHHPTAGMSASTTPGSHLPAESAEVVVSVLTTVMERFQVLPRAADKLKFVTAVLRPVLASYLEALDAEASVCDLGAVTEESDHRGWSRFLTVLNSAFYLRDSILEWTTSPVLLEVEQWEVAARRRQRAARTAGGIRALAVAQVTKNVTDVAASVLTARAKMKEKAEASGAMQTLQMMGLGVVARTLLTGRPDVDAPAAEEETKGEAEEPAADEEPVAEEAPAVVDDLEDEEFDDVAEGGGLFGSASAQLDRFVRAAIKRAAAALGRGFTDHNRRYKAKRQAGAFFASSFAFAEVSGLATVGDGGFSVVTGDSDTFGSDVDVSPELCETLSHFRHDLGFAAARLARHEFIRLLGHVSDAVASYLLNDVVFGGTVTLAGAQQLRHDTLAVSQVVRSFTGQTGWASVRQSFSRLQEACEVLCLEGAAMRRLLTALEELSTAGDIDGDGEDMVAREAANMLAATGVKHLQARLVLRLLRQRSF